MFDRLRHIFHRGYFYEPATLKSGGIHVPRDSKVIVYFTDIDSLYFIASIKGEEVYSIDNVSVKDQQGIEAGKFDTFQVITEHILFIYNTEFKPNPGYEGYISPINIPPVV